LGFVEYYFVVQNIPDAKILKIIIKLGHYSFFLFAIYMMFVNPVHSFIGRYMEVSSLSYILSFLLIVTLSLASVCIVKKISTKIFDVLNGGR
jgi:membrane-anchored protein YejM (alkaline phosphatase superfamily)